MPSACSRTLPCECVSHRTRRQPEPPVGGSINLMHSYFEMSILNISQKLLLISPTTQRGGQGPVHPQDLPPSTVSGAGRLGGRQPALPAEERHHQEDPQWGRGRRAQTLPVHLSQTAGGEYKWRPLHRNTCSPSSHIGKHAAFKCLSVGRIKYFFNVILLLLL